MQSNNSAHKPVRRFLSVPRLRRKRLDSHASEATIHAIPPLPSRDRCETQPAENFQLSLDSTEAPDSVQPPSSLECITVMFQELENERLSQELRKELGFRDLFTLPTPFTYLESTVAVMRQQIYEMQTQIAQLKQTQEEQKTIG
ncbi:hypothetical protein MSAN_02402900 [Mycena sanguinolenta]|uniref:Uncharacterized protein n=1 Tax=Mycena sanguinolenta TaxID=230812 RepID=A0A8H6X4K1_9AGAR|nr:hypothetical protein MSAN_02402900 [Mycena sanguinolenta]